MCCAAGRIAFCAVRLFLPTATIAYCCRSAAALCVASCCYACLHPNSPVAEGVFGSGSSLAIFKHDANESSILFNPTGLLCLRNDPAPPANTSSSEGLSAAAIAGIAVGTTAATVAVAGLLAALLLRQRQRRRRALDALKQSGSLSGDMALQIAVLPSSAEPDSTDSPFATEAAAAAAVAAFGPAAAGPAASSAKLVHGAGRAPQRLAAGAALSAAASAALLDGAGSGPPEAVPELVQLVSAADVAASPQPAIVRPAAARGSASSRSSGSGEAAAQLPSPDAILPAGLREYVIDPSAIEYCRLPSGKLHLLGEGARWAGWRGRVENGCLTDGLVVPLRHDDVCKELYAVCCAASELRQVTRVAR